MKFHIYTYLICVVCEIYSHTQIHTKSMYTRKRKSHTRKAIDAVLALSETTEKENETIKYLMRVE